MDRNGKGIMNKEIYYISEMMEDARHAGSKARMDVERILSAEGLPVLDRVENIAEPSFFSKLRHKASPRYLAKLSRLLLYRHKNCILQYPFYYDKITDRVMKKFAERNDIILLVHDVDSLRSWEGTRSKQEIAFLNRMKLLIVHNRRMAEKLQGLGVQSPMVELGLFDYLLQDRELPCPDRKLGKEIAFAGNLYKSRFLQSREIENLDLQLNLYGLNFSQEKMGWKNVSYQGSYGSEEIPYQLQGAFGLIWDGESLDTCAGSFGTYMRYNNPHKLSLYVAARLPIITWKEAAIAEFVDRHQIGFCVDSLQDIPRQTEQVSAEEYKGYLDNIAGLQERVVRGIYTKEAIERGLAIL
ncbi:MAG: hypothetical protein IJU00_05495 [Selenomonas sp.]|nr:hypothetical protein [Selenomonas sp.]